jgi:hypothetical protein
MGFAATCSARRDRIVRETPQTRFPAEEWNLHPVAVMADTTAIPELQKPSKPRPEKGRPQREPEIKRPPDVDDKVVDKEDQGDSGPDKENPLTHPSKGSLTPADAHIGAREDQVSDTQAPSGDAFKDEPKQG